MLIVINISRVLYHARDYNPAIFQIINKANVDEFSRLREDKRPKRNDGAPGVHPNWPRPDAYERRSGEWREIGGGTLALGESGRTGRFLKSA
jgi:hypothetical protein